METFSSTDALEMAIGAIFVAFHAYGRYNTPASNHSSTTRQRFFACYGLYAGTLVGIYWLVTVGAWMFPEIFYKLASTFFNLSPNTGDGTSNVEELLRSPITTALIFTTLLPNFPMLKRADRNLLRLFWDLAEIPGHAVKLAHRMYRAPYHIHPNKYPQLDREARSYDIELSESTIMNQSTPAFAWARLGALLIDIRQWHHCADQKYRNFFLANELEIEELSTRYSNYSARIAAFYRRFNDQTESPKELQQELAGELLTDGRDLYMKLCRLTAHAVLDAETGSRARLRAIETLGFEPARYDSDTLSAVQLLQLSGLIMLTFFAIATIRYLPEGGISQEKIGNVIFFALLMAANYGLSALAGVYPKSRWRFADIEATRHRPWLGYFFSGGLAVFASLLVISSLRVTRYTFEGRGYDGSFDQLLIDLSWSYPYLYLSFAIGFGVAWLCDSGNGTHAHQARNRLHDALTMAVILLAVSYLSYASMFGFFPFEGTKDPAFRSEDQISVIALLEFLVQGAIAGALIGALVPQWYRANRYSSPLHRVLRFIERNDYDLQIEAGRLNPGELKQALVTSAAATALADGILDDPERDVFRNCLIKLAEKNILDFEVEEGIEEMMATIQIWRAQELYQPEQAPLAGLEPLRGREVISELMAQTASAIAHADGTFEHVEQRVIEQIISALNLDPEIEMAACGAAKCDDFQLRQT